IDKKATWRSARGARILTRRDTLALGAATATSLYLSGGLLRSASAQTSFDFYIGPNGNDTNPGTLDQPWALTALNTKGSIYAGQTVGLLDGTYGIQTLLGAQPTGVNNRG